MDCIAPWPYEEVQRNEALIDAVQERAALAGAKARSAMPRNLTLSSLLCPEGVCHQRFPGKNSFAAYTNDQMCARLEGSGVQVLRTWLPSAILGSRDSARFGDCIHPRVRGSILTMWNVLLLTEV